MAQSTFLSEEHPASHSASPDSEAEWMTSVVTWPSSSLGWLNESGHSGWSGKTSPEYCHLMEDGTLAPSSGRWRTSGMGSRTGFLTLSSSEWPSDGDVCFLSDILETGDHLQQFSLSPKACQGILRRAGKRGKKLPEVLEAALRSTSSE